MHAILPVKSLIMDILADRIEPETSWKMPALEQAILATIAYADVFDYPLTLREIHWYLCGIPASLREVYAGLRRLDCGSRQLVSLAYVPGDGAELNGGYYTLPGREETVDLRRERGKNAVPLWQKARAYAQTISHLPFVRMVALTGALAMGNVEPGDDLDFLIVTEPGRLWLCRACVIALGYWATRGHDLICPNYFISERALALQDRNLYTAHEIAQMIPLAGMDTYARMRACNAWVQEFLPNALGTPRLSHKLLVRSSDPGKTSKSRRRLQRATEAALRTPPGRLLESWEMQRKLRKFRLQQASHPESNFSPDYCKGHFNDHERRTLTAYARRLQALELECL
jgi:hypothetical protein